MRPSRVYKAEGIILKRRSVGEADRILTVFTNQYGKIRVLAKGVRKITSRRAGHIEVFSHVIMTIHQGHTLDMVSEAQALRNGSLFDTDAIRLSYAYCLAELVDQLLADHQEHRDVFLFLKDSLNALLTSSLEAEYQQILSDFVHHLLWNLGFLPQARTLTGERMKAFVEGITERSVRSWPHLTEVSVAS